MIAIVIMALSIIITCDCCCCSVAMEICTIPGNNWGITWCIKGHSGIIIVIIMTGSITNTNTPRAE